MNTIYKSLCYIFPHFTKEQLTVEHDGHTVVVEDNVLRIPLAFMLVIFGVIAYFL